ncbi:MAG TPA: OmpA family protein [Bacteroidales bacterium]|nr:OmpA family protein [Bacteroidales bacterium]HPS71608.1 OmpA family protein [Bacteroidales bacterium]
MKILKFFSLIIFIVLFFDIHAQKIDTAKSALVNVVVTNFKNKPQKGEQILFESVKTKLIYKGITDAKGTFKIYLKGGDTYKVLIKSVGEEDEYNTFEIPALAEGEFYTESTLTVQFELPKTFTLDNVQFETGKASLTNTSYKELNELIEYLKLKETVVIEIAGHTDDVGEDSSNQKLSEARATTVRNYLISKGIAAKRVQAKGYGETQPIAPNSTPEGRQKNRRTEVRILSGD